MKTVLRPAAFLLPLALSLAAVAPAWAHRLNVFAFVEGDEVVVESKFSTGRIPVAGTVRVSDATETELATFDLAPDGTARFPLDREAAGGGLSIVVTTGGEHEGYWILTPDDIGKGGAASRTEASRTDASETEPSETAATGTDGEAPQ